MPAPGYTRHSFRDYLSLLLLFLPPLLFAGLLLSHRGAPQLGWLPGFPYLPWQFWAMGVLGGAATVGGVLDWRYHRDPLHMNISKKEREAEALALGAGGLPMFVLMWLAMWSERPALYLVPIVVVLVYTVVAICYDEFVFHFRRCGRQETLYHRLLVLGNGLAWLAWFHFIYY